MQITDTHQQLIDTTEKFITKEINPNMNDWEQAGIYPAKEIMKKMGDLGLLGIHKPEAYGGMGLDYSYEMAFAEALGIVEGGSVPMSIGVQTNMATPALAAFGSDELKAEFLTPAIKGDMVASIAVSEPQAGSDVSQIKTYAKEDGDDYIISGSKMWITNAKQADYFCTLVNTGEGPVHSNKSLIIIPSQLKGVSTGEPLKKMGMRSSDTAPVFFDEVRVPKRNRIGQEGKGFAYQMQQFQEERMFAAASVLRNLESCITSTIEYTQERNVFGKPLIANQYIQFNLCELQSEIESLRGLLYRATDLYTQKQDVTKLASMAKFKAGKLCRQVTDTCLQYFGGTGFLEETLVNRLHRDNRLISIGGGADEVMLGIIAKYLGLAKK